MRALSPARLELIDALVAEADTGGITAALLEKDEHLTDALGAVFELKFEHATLVFCGGSSLSKAHGLIERMSEDADIKVVLDGASAAWSKNKIRRYLGDEVRGRVAEAMASLGFTEEIDKRRSLNDNRYMHSQWAYQRTYDGIAALRPSLQLELVTRRPVLTTQPAQIESLADRLAHSAGHSPQAVVVSIAETLAEKILSFLRRFAMHRAGQMRQAWDTALVRHIYDSHCIVQQTPTVVDAARDAFVTLAIGDSQTREEYERNLLPLVYGRIKPSFDEAWSTFRSVANELLAAL